MKKKVLIFASILLSLITFSEVKKMQYYKGAMKIQKFSTEDEKFSGNYDLIVPEIRIENEAKPKVYIRFLEIGKLHGFRKIKITNGKDIVILNVEENESMFTFVNFKHSEVVSKEIELVNLETLLKMTLANESINLSFVNKENEVIEKELNAKEKEILKWTIINYKLLLGME